MTDSDHMGFVGVSTASSSIMTVFPLWADILGLPTNARPSDIRRAYARRPRRFHPDFQDAGTVLIRGADGAHVPVPDTVPGDIAIDFIDASALSDRIQAAFFRDGS